jgi:hypothetical protein
VQDRAAGLEYLVDPARERQGRSGPAALDLRNVRSVVTGPHGKHTLRVSDELAESFDIRAESEPRRRETGAPEVVPGAVIMAGQGLRSPHRHSVSMHELVVNASAGYRHMRLWASNFTHDHATALESPQTHHRGAFDRFDATAPQSSPYSGGPRLGADRYCDNPRYLDRTPRRGRTAMDTAIGLFLALDQIFNR